MGPTPPNPTIDYIPFHATHVPASFARPPTTTGHVSPAKSDPPPSHHRRRPDGHPRRRRRRPISRCAPAALRPTPPAGPGLRARRIRRRLVPSSPADDQPPSPASPPPASPLLPNRPDISVALSDDRRPLVRRKPSLDPSAAASAARAIPPVPVLRSGSSGSASYGKSAPVNVPVWPKARSSGRLGIRDEDVNGDGDGEGEVILPPHEIVARSHDLLGVRGRGEEAQRPRSPPGEKCCFSEDWFS